MNPESRSLLPGIAFGDFEKRFQEPKAEEGFQDVVRVDFQFQGKSGEGDGGGSESDEEEEEEKRRLWSQFYVWEYVFSFTFCFALFGLVIVRYVMAGVEVSWARIFFSQGNAR